jgi:hypothetical protein
MNQAITLYYAKTRGTPLTCGFTGPVRQLCDTR